MGRTLDLSIERSVFEWFDCEKVWRHCAEATMYPIKELLYETDIKYGYGRDTLVQQWRV